VYRLDDFEFVVRVPAATLQGVDPSQVAVRLRSGTSPDQVAPGAAPDALHPSSVAGAEDAVSSADVIGAVTLDATPLPDALREVLGA
jgi:hypothetical protein